MPQAALHIEDVGGGGLPLPPDGWPSARQAAAALGLTERTVRYRLQVGRLPGVLCRGTYGPSWYVDPSLVPALRIATGHVDTPVAAGGQLADLSEQGRLDVARRAAAVRAFLAARDTGGPVAAGDAFVRAWCADYSRRTGHSLRRTTLYAWIAAYRRAGVAGLVDGRRRGGRHCSEWSPDAMESIVAMYVASHGGHGGGQNRLSITRCHEMSAAIADHHGWTMPSLRVAQRYIARRVDPKLLTAGRDPARFEDRMLPTVTRDWSLVAAGECWFADHRRLDVFVPANVAGTWRWYRPWLTMWLDARTWKPMSWRMEFTAPTGRRVMETFVTGVTTYGLPDVAYMDNGKDFRMHRFAGGRGERLDLKGAEPMLSALEVDTRWALPYNAKTKTIEPWFRLMSERFDKMWETYCGNRPENKPRRWQCRFGDLSKSAQKFAAEGFTIDALRSAFDRWVTDDYCGRECPVSASKPYSVEDAWRRFARPDIRRPADADLALLLMPSKHVRVTANGVWCAAHRRHYWAPELADRVGASGRDIARHVVYRWLEADPAIVWVFDATTGRFIAAATPYAGEGVHPLAEAGSDDADRVATVMSDRARMQRATRETLRDLHRRGREMLLDAQRKAGEMHRPVPLDPADLPTPRTVIPLLPDIGTAGRAGADLARRQRVTNQQRNRNASHAAQTGTDAVDQTPIVDVAARAMERLGRIDTA